MYPFGYIFSSKMTTQGPQDNTGGGVMGSYREWQDRKGANLAKGLWHQLKRDGKVCRECGQVVGHVHLSTCSSERERVGKADLPETAGFINDDKRMTNE